MSGPGAVVEEAAPEAAGAARWAPEFAPVDLDTVPEVEVLLRRLGFGGFIRDELAPAPVGRNQMWAGPTESGKMAFVKRLTGPPRSVEQRMKSVLSFERVRAGVPEDVFRSPRVLGADPEAGLLVFEYLTGARPGNQLVVDQTFDDELARATGKAIGVLHDTVPEEGEELDKSQPDLPSSMLLDGLPAPMFDRASFAELETWRLLQHDQPVVDAVRRLREIELTAPRGPAHCDMRMDQLLIADEGLFISDWEEFRWADPARDVGSFAGEWLSRSVLDIVTSRGDSQFLDADLSHEVVIQRGVSNLQRLRTRVVSFWQGYVEARASIDEGLAERATAFAGWHLLDRLLASAARNARLSGIERAGAGIGRAALLSPAKFSAVIGLGVSE